VEVFVWTATGTTVHIAPSESDPVSTLCGRPVAHDADAFDVLWYSVCRKCKSALAAETGFSL
jgi:hypothetical protein